MMLKNAIAYIQQLEQDFNRREALVRIVINADKTAKTNERIRFLLQCKRAGLYPRFITQSVRNISYVFKNNLVIEKRREAFCRQLLNESIKEAFRTQAFRHREYNRLHREATHHQHCDLVFHLASEVYEHTSITTVKTHRKKFSSLYHERYSSEDADRRTNAAPDGDDDDIADHNDEAWDHERRCANETSPLPPSDGSDHHRLEQELWYDCSSEVQLQTSEQLIDDNEMQKIPRTTLPGQDIEELWYDCHSEGHSQLSLAPVSDTRVVPMVYSSVTAACKRTTGGKAAPRQTFASGNEIETLTESEVNTFLSTVDNVQRSPLSECRDGGPETCEMWHDCLSDHMDDGSDPIWGDEPGFSVSGPVAVTDADGDTWYDCYVANDSIMLSNNDATQSQTRSISRSSHIPCLERNQFENRDRFLNMTDKALPDPVVDLLSKGPNFALSRSINKNVLKDVEIGLERGAFALRWKEDIDMRSNRNQFQSLCCAPHGSSMPMTSSTRQPDSCEAPDPDPDPDLI